MGLPPDDSVLYCPIELTRSLRSACSRLPRCVTRILGYKDAKTMMNYIHVFNWGGKGVESPMDDL